jgi:hypothetical protein
MLFASLVTHLYLLHLTQKIRLRKVTLGDQELIHRINLDSIDHHHFTEFDEFSGVE